jgi:hypothetical protein
VDIPFYWETTLADHNSYITTLKSCYGATLLLEDRVYSEDRLTVTNVMVAESIEHFVSARTKANNEMSLLRYWADRDYYNYHENIFKVLTEI